jgi:hypothetical protein
VLAVLGTVVSGSRSIGYPRNSPPRYSCYCSLQSLSGRSRVSLPILAPQTSIPKRSNFQLGDLLLIPVDPEQRTFEPEPERDEDFYPLDIHRF